MSELNYKELQEKGVFDVPYKAFQFMQEQQAIIDDLRSQLNNMEAVAKNDLEAMKDPNNVHNLMIRGVIGTPALMQCLHLHGSEAIERWNRIDQLKSQLNNMEACYIEKKKELEDQQKRIDEALICVDRATDGYYGFSEEGGDTDNLAKHLEKALRGEHESKPK